jgi:putative RecB family exonuclease
MAQVVDEIVELGPVDLPMPTFRKPSEAPWPGQDSSQPERPFRPHVSASQLSSFTGCGHRFYLERVVPQEERATPLPAWALIGGTAIHKTFDEIVVEGLKGNVAAAEAIFRANFAEEVIRKMDDVPNRAEWRASGRASKAYPDKENRDWWAENGAAQCVKFATVYDSPFLPGRVVSVDGNFLIEVEHLVEIGDGPPVKGYIDAVIELPDGSIIPRDYKSGKAPEDAIQLASYALAMHELYGVEPTTGEYLLTRKMVAATWDLRPLTRAVMAGLYESLEKAKASGIYLPRPSSFCSACQVKAACIYRPQEEASSDD